MQKNLEIKEIVLNRRANGESVKTISYDTGVPRRIFRNFEQCLIKNIKYIIKNGLKSTKNKKTTVLIQH